MDPVSTASGGPLPWPILFPEAADQLAGSLQVTKISTEMIKILAKKMHGQAIQTIDGGVQGMFRTRDHLR